VPLECIAGIHRSSLARMKYVLAATQLAHRGTASQMDLVAIDATTANAEQMVRDASRRSKVFPQIDLRLRQRVVVSHTPFDRVAMYRACDKAALQISCLQSINHKQVEASLLCGGQDRSTAGSRG
jgi:hypothetical protein